jgi:hypothetical protein
MKGLYYLLCLLFFMFSIYKCEAKSYTCIPTGDTTNIEHQFSKIIRLDIDTFKVPFVNGKYWETGILTFRSNFTFILDSGVVLFVQKGIFPLDTISYGLFRLNNLNYINIVGYGAIIQFDINEYTAGEWRHCIFIEGSNHINIYGLSIVECSGDAICINWNSAVAYSEFIRIKDVLCDANARQGISIISAKKVLIEHCIFQYTGKKNHHQLASAGPWAGIDLEPDNDLQFLADITINDCVFNNNKGDGFLLAYGGQINTVNLNRNQFYNNNRSAFAFVGILRGYKGLISIKESLVWGKQECAFFVRDWNSTKQKIVIDQLTIKGSQIQTPFYFLVTPQLKTLRSGNFSCKRLILVDWNSDKIIVKEGENVIHQFEQIDIKGISQNTIRDSKNKDVRIFIK